MEGMVAYCGLICTGCEAYVATQANDLAALERLAARAREELGMPNATCDDYPCNTLEAFWRMAPEARATLHGIRTRLVA